MILAKSSLSKALRAFGPVLAAGLMGAGAFAADGNLMHRQLEALAHSEFRFARGGSYVPFPPLAYLGGSYYGDTKAEPSDGEGRKLTYNMTGLVQAAGLPLLISERDAIIIGDYLSYSEFHIDGDSSEDFSITSAGIPVGWLRQVNPRWQAAAFVLPMAHYSNLGEGGWSWQYMSGVFARYVHSEQLWWAFGFYADIEPGDNFYIPYFGATWMINEHWTLSGIMPWPGILYAPNNDWLFRFGVSPSGASWSVPSQTDDDVALNLDAWDLGLSIERRLFGRIFASLETGVGGFRGLRVNGDGFHDTDFEIHSSPYIRLDLNFRPGDFLP